MNEHEGLAERFEENRTHLRAVAYRMLGSVSEAEDAVQEAWLRLDRSDISDVQNLGGWLTTVVGRVCLDMLRSRTSRREDAFDVHVPDPIVTRADGTDPEHEAELTDSVGLAMLVVLDTLPPAERLAFVLHDMFAVPFDDIAPIVDRAPAATRRLASRARRRVQGGAPAPETDPTRRRRVVDAFMAASRGGDFEALLAVLDPDVLLRVDGGVADMSKLIRGAVAVAQQALTFARFAEFGRVVLVNGAAGLMTVPDGRPLSLMDFTVTDGRITEINLLADPERLDRIDLKSLDII
ncbi:sigma-70 family RNA polymerase sigma factor [Embleya sp. NBC_00896]|uniref:sigma-70 family RNA polymerase sigma factor n=1 Tax=Embleya sp. NBC_00896 TaxID=2975961 RepID=UPI003866BEAC|nr:sigma-70 family RNA polymerase sigma factor [Embleya sp. NBC_00896]